DAGTEAGGEFAPIKSGSVHGSRPPVRLGGAQHRANDAVVGAAAAEVARKRRAHVRLARPRIAVKQFLRRHDHAIDAVAALRRLLRNESLLEGMQLVERAKSVGGAAL